MADINAYDSIVSQYSAKSTTAQSGTKVVGKDDFLKMLVAQLKNQDPLNPMEGSDFAAQLAQFSSLEQLTNLNDGMKNLGLYYSSQTNIQAVSLIGKEVTVGNGNAFDANQAPVDLYYDLSGNAKTVQVGIYDSDGSLVDTVKAADQTSGSNHVTWNGAANKTGSYTFKVTATGENGADINAEMLVSGKVTAVSFKDNTIYLTVAGKEVAFSDVKAVKS